MRLSRLACACVLCLFGRVADADILAGRSPGGPPATPADIVAIFGDDATGDVAPLALLGGSTTTMQSASTMSYDADQRTLLVADFWGQKVHVFAAASRGDAAPLRTFFNASIGQVRQVAAIPAFDEYAVISSSFIKYFPRSANGDTAALRSTSYLPELLNNMSGLIYLSATDEVAVGDGYDLGGSNFAGEVLFFNRSDSGAVTPTRRIAGELTKLGTWVVGLASDPVHGEIFVLAENADGTNSIHVFAQNADGNVAPLRSIEGPATIMENARGMSYYELGDELLVASGFFDATPHLLGFPRTASGNATPSRDISGVNTGTSINVGWSAVVGLPLEVVFEDGFE